MSFRQQRDIGKPDLSLPMCKKACWELAFGVHIVKLHINIYTYHMYIYILNMYILYIFIITAGYLEYGIRNLTIFRAFKN